MSRNTIRKAAILWVAWLVSLAIALHAGSFLGMHGFMLASAKSQAVVAADRLHLMDRHRLGDLRYDLEMDLDTALIRHADAMDSRLPWLWPGLRDDPDRAMPVAAAYRRSHPFRWPDIDRRLSDAASARELEAANAELEARKARVLQAYPE